MIHWRLGDQDAARRSFHAGLAMLEAGGEDGGRRPRAARKTVSELGAG